MKILVIGDIHWSTYSSILRTRGKTYSTRLENLIKSVNWAEEQATLNNCEIVVYLGDFFDKSDLTAEEITALREIKWSSLRHYFLVGNHESNVSSLIFSSTNTLNRDNFFIVDNSWGLNNLVFIPYITEDNRLELRNYLRAPESPENVTINPIIFSHNDIKGIQYGCFESKQGFELSDIEKNIGTNGLYLNGHIHNGQYVDKNKRIINLGNLTGQNFSENASKYEHHILILETDGMQTTFIENPYAMNFYKLEINEYKDLSILDTLKNNAIVSIKCNALIVQELRLKLEKNNKILASKILIYLPEASDIVEVPKDTLTNVDHLQQFKTFILNTLENTEELKEELSEVLK